MKYLKSKSIFVFFLGMLTFAVASFLVSTFVFVEKPVTDGIIEDWGQICFWPDVDGLYASVSPKGCYSTTCTRPTLESGTAIVDVQNRKIQFDVRFLIVKTSRFPLPCVDNCSGGGSVLFKLDPLIPNDYEVWFGDLKVGGLRLLSNDTPRQCFENQPE